MTSGSQAAGGEAVLTHDDAGVRTITLNRPGRLNAIDLSMLRQLEAAIRSAQDDELVRVLHLRGAGRAFCAGDDVHAQAAVCEGGERALRAQLETLQRISELLTLGPKLAVAEVQGWAIGAGFSWVLNCDFRLWGSSARAFFPEVGFGTFVTGGATFLLPLLVGLQAASELLFAGTKIDSTSPKTAGIVHSIHPESDLAQAAATCARDLALLPQPAAGLMKRALTSAMAADFRAALKAEIEVCVATTLNPQTLENMRAAIDRN